MAEAHVLQWTAAFLGALYLTLKLFLAMPEQRWQHLILGATATLLWIPVAYLADNVGVADGGSSVAFGSEALAAFAIFMVVVNILGIVLGLLFWVEAEARDASQDLPDHLRPGRGPREGD